MLKSISSSWLYGSKNCFENVMNEWHGNVLDVAMAPSLPIVIVDMRPSDDIRDVVKISLPISCMVLQFHASHRSAQGRNAACEELVDVLRRRMELSGRVAASSFALVDSFQPWWSFFMTVTFPTTSAT